MDWFRLNWTGPFPIETAHKRKESDDIGIYAIYVKQGRTPKLMYIGQTYSQGFANRLKQHRREWLDRVRGTKLIHFGVLDISEDRRISYRKISDIEAFLIWKYKPPENRKSHVFYRGRDIFVFNTGKIGVLDKAATDDREFMRFLQKSFAKH